MSRTCSHLSAFKFLFWWAASCHDGGLESPLELRGKVVDFMVAVNIYRLGGGVEHDFAVFALGDVVFDFCEEFGLDAPVEVVGELGEEISTCHQDWPSRAVFGKSDSSGFFCLK